MNEKDETDNKLCVCETFVQEQVNIGGNNDMIDTGSGRAAIYPV